MQHPFIQFTATLLIRGFWLLLKNRLRHLMKPLSLSPSPVFPKRIAFENTGMPAYLFRPKDLNQNNAPYSSSPMAMMARLRICISLLLFMPPNEVIIVYSLKGPVRAKCFLSKIFRCGQTGKR